MRNQLCAQILGSCQFSEQIAPCVVTINCGSISTDRSNLRRLSSLAGGTALARSLRTTRQRNGAGPRRTHREDTQMVNFNRPVGRRPFLRGALASAASLAAFGTRAFADEPIKVGILHSLSGTMAISETTLKDVMLMLIEQQNKKGGLLGKKLEAVVVDPASNWPLFAEKARQLISVDKCAATFGCWTSVSRKS